MSKLIVSKDKDGNVITTSIAEDVVAEVLENKKKFETNSKTVTITQKEIDDYGMSLVRKDWLHPRYFDLKELPDDFFIDGWVYDVPGNKVVLTLEDAKKAFYKKIRNHRRERFHWLDFKTARAIGQKNDKLIDEIEDEKQVLRDLTKTVDISDASDLNEIKRKYPWELLTVKKSDKQ